MKKPYRVTFSILAFIADTRNYAAFHTEPIHDIRNAREIAIRLKRGCALSVYIEKQDDEGYWNEVIEEREVVDGRK